MYRLTITTVDQAPDEAEISIDKLLDEDSARQVIIAIMQAEHLKQVYAEMARRRDEEHERRLSRHSGDPKP